MILQKNKLRIQYLIIIDVLGVGIEPMEDPRGMDFSYLITHYIDNYIFWYIT